MAGNIPRGSDGKNLGVLGHNVTTGFSNILEDVVFVLSGFVNPERGMLRSQAMKMGAQYQSDWNEDCTLLVCAFPNTPKYMHVKDCCGTIVSKKWISECYEQKKLVEIDAYLMYAGRPWRRNIFQDSTALSQIKSEDLTLSSQLNMPSLSFPIEKNEPLNSRNIFSPSQVKEWSISDLNATISWLESQAEKPDTREIKSIALEGILTCLQDAIDCLKKGQNISVMVNDWKFIPRVVNEIVKLEDANLGLLMTHDELLQQAVACQGVYEMEFKGLAIKEQEKRFDSSDDETVEMTNEEIEDTLNHLLLVNRR